VVRGNAGPEANASSNGSSLVDRLAARQSERRETGDPKLQRKNKLAERRAAILHAVEDVLRSWARSLRRLAPLGVLRIRGAFLLPGSTKAYCSRRASSPRFITDM
jgi:hypothetical protein